MKKWKRPTIVNVGGLTFKILYQSNADKKSELYPDRWGLIDTEKRTIYVDKSLDNEMMRFILLHELLHLCGDFLNPNAGKKNPFAEERYTRPFTHMLLQALVSTNLFK